MQRIQLLDVADLQRSMPADAAFDEGLAIWAIEMVSAAALNITRTNWVTPEDVPNGALPIIAVATRRLYANPDRFTREAEGDYSYALDPSVTGADIFTPSEKATLENFRPDVTRITGLRTISTFRGDAYAPSTGYVPDGSAQGFPWYDLRGGS